MRLPSLPFFKKTPPREYFLALLLQDEGLTAVVLEETQGTIHIVGEGKSMLPAPLDDTSFEELLSASDKAISKAENSLPGNVQSHKTIFGVKEDWTEDLQISKDHLASLKKLCDELDLEPIGFLVFAEAIAHLLQKEEGAPVSAVLVELGTHHITATLLRAGRVVTSKQAPITDNLPKAVDTLLMAFTDAEILPSRIILLDNQKRPRLTQQFTNHAWSKQLPFLHVPQITPLADGFETKAILFGTATQMGFDMLGLPEIKETKEDLPAGKQAKETEEANETEVNEEEVKKPQEIENGETSKNAIASSFAKGETPHNDENLFEENENLEESENTPEPVDDSVSSEALGFVKDRDVLESAPKKPIAFDNVRTLGDEDAETLADETFANIPEEVKEDEEGMHLKLPGIGLNAAKITEGMQKVLSLFKKNLKKTPPASDESTSSKKLFIFLPVALLLIIGSILWYIFGVKATATLYINPKNVTASQGVTFSTSQSTDAQNDIIGATATPITESGTSSTQATGSQDVGDKAKGTVTMYNNDSDSHTIDAGTTITSSNGLDFITSTDVTISSASGDIFSGTKPGTADVDVTASDIGTQYNLPSDTKFSIGSSSILAAKNDNAFSGGTKKTVTVVSQKDLDKLTSDLTSNLGDKAKQDAQNATTSDKAVLSTFLSTTMSNQKFDHKVGDQVGSVDLAGTITYSALTYSKADLDKISLAIIQSNNQGEDISQDNITESIDKPTVSTDGKDINATLSIKAGLLPKIDGTKIAQELSGKSFNQAMTVLSDVPQLEEVRGILSPNIFFLPKIFPRIASHITVGIKANE